MATHAITLNMSGGGDVSPSLSLGLAVVIDLSGGGDISLDASLIRFIRNVRFGFVGVVDVALNSANLAIERTQVWWSSDYTYRCPVIVQAVPNGIEKGHPLVFRLSKNVIRQGKIRTDLADIEVVRLISFVPEQWTVLPKQIVAQDTSIEVTWANDFDTPVGVPLTDTYFVYYGNPELVGSPVVADYSPTVWPVTIYPDSDLLTYTRPGEHWANGEALERLAKTTFGFYGDKLQIWANVGLDFGIAEVQIDDGPWQQADLHSPVSDNKVVFTVSGLPIGGHVLRYRVSGLANPASKGTKVNFTKIDYEKHNVTFTYAEEADNRLMWSSAIGGVV